MTDDELGPFDCIRNRPGVQCISERREVWSCILETGTDAGWRRWRRCFHCYIF